MKFWTLLFAVFLGLSSLNAEAARRFGGGGSFGKQSSNVTQRQAPAPAQGANNAAVKPGSAAAPGQAPKRPWGAMLGGLAAGLGLAWLANSLGLGEGMGQILMFALLVMGVMMVVGWLMRRRAAPTPVSSPFAFHGVGSVPVAPNKPYSPDNVGNDASARPWERSSMAFDASQVASGSAIGSALAGSQSWGIPAGFDAQGFLAAAKTNFVTLQAAWDRSDIAALRAMMTDDMLVEIRAQLAERESHSAGSPNQTEVVMIEARLLGIEDQGDVYMASVEFSGMIREEFAAGPSPFREVWNMTKAKSGASGWLVAGVQALQ
jgi:predicted lipid-binding transport protein (Tim44 family)